MDAGSWVFVRELIGVLYRRGVLDRAAIDALVHNVEGVAENPDTPAAVAADIRAALAEFDDTLIPPRPS